MTQNASPEDVIQRLYGDGKPVPFVMLAALIAGCASFLPKLMRQMIGRERTRISRIASMPLENWVALYTNHRRLMNAALAFFTGSEEDIFPISQEWQKFIHAPEELRRAEIEAAVAEDPDAFKELLSMMQGVPFPPNKAVLREFLRAMGDSNDGSDAEEEQDENSPFDVPELVYFLRVWFPCYVLHKTYPPMLMRKARRGCNDAFELLLRLDKSVIFDPVLACRWHEVVHGTDWRLRKRLLKAMNEAPRGKLDPKRIRLMLAGLISQLATAFKCKVTSTEIGELFHRLESIRTGELGDHEIPEAENLLKAIQRNRNWPSFPQD